MAGLVLIQKLKTQSQPWVEVTSSKVKRPRTTTCGSWPIISNKIIHNKQKMEIKKYLSQHSWPHTNEYKITISHHHYDIDTFEIFPPRGVTSASVPPGKA